MQVDETTPAEGTRLRRTMRDLVALSTLPAVWAGLDLEGIARSLAEALLKTLALDLVYVRLAINDQEKPIEIVRCSFDPPLKIEDVRGLTESLNGSDSQQAATALAELLGEPRLALTTTRFGVSDHEGLLIAGARRAGFPSEQERLLLSVGANQTSVVATRRRVEEELVRQQEWLSVTLDSISDGVIASDTQGRITFMNDVAASMCGWSRSEAIGRELQSVLTVVDAISRQPTSVASLHTLTEKRSTFCTDQALLVSRVGSECIVDGTAAPLRDAGGRLLGTVLTLRDTTTRTNVERQRTARLAVTQALNQASTLEEGLSSVLQAVCESLGWDVGFFWGVGPDGQEVSCRASGHRSTIQLNEFEVASRDYRFQKHQGLPGRTWGDGKPQWILDIREDQNFPRLAAARKCRLHSALAYPVTVQGRSLGVIEFFTQRIREPDSNLLELMGTVAGNVGQFIERKLAEEDLRRSEQELADFFDNATVGLHWVGPDGTILRANRAELEMLGYEREEYVGRSIEQFHADRDVINDILCRLKTGQKLKEYPARMRCKDGSLKDVLIDSSVLWRDGEFVHSRCFTRDITDRKKAETALAEARVRLDAALAVGAVATWTWDIPSNRLFADQTLARMFNLTAAADDGDLLTKYIKSIHPDDWPHVEAALLRSVESGNEYQADYRVIQDDGSVRWVAARGRCEFNGTKPPTRMLGVLVDITERKRLEMQLLEADRRKDEFLATLAHELRNPLAPIRNAIEILKLSDADQTTRELSRDIMERQLEHLVRLVDDLLDVSRVMRGKIELRRAKTDLATVISRAIEIAEPLIQEKGHRLSVTSSGEALQLDADAVRLVQAIGNLLTNAAKYTEANGQIWLDSSWDGQDAVIKVRDSGIGISADHLPTVFQPFVQVEHGTMRSHGGLGIGLTLVKSLVEMHGGTVEAHSAGLGKGSEFVVRLPAAASTTEPTKAPERPLKGAHRSPGRHRLMVVDDNEDAAVSLALLLKFQGHDVRVVHDGSSALQEANRFRPEMVFLDIGMPGMDGHEVARRIRQSPGLEGVVLTALTGWGQQDDRRRTADAGFDHHLVKPPEPAVVRALVASLQKAALRDK